ncbi:hypothetical protein FG93_03315 [Bosea sp. LC85]|uniref:hypothetical protein n=1 Tax=Bosea sp. LC85 TaxID=1502851 RepID=UPI0004E42104|nr:hypothetical protein [Bosea sp. LC85]KFC69269.1 hypothetical protein FG93_03315 [Bosea sp. LC85]
MNHLGVEIGQQSPDKTWFNLALKLKLTALALGCPTNKELCARFAAINPATLFVTQNAYKWLSGKAMPRAASVYEDWSKVLGGSLTAPFLASSSFEEFQHAICAHFGVPDTVLATLRREAGLPPVPAPSPVAPAAARAGARQPGEHWLAGSYLAISPAWSRVEVGKLIIGAMRICADPMQQLQISYSENLFNRPVAMEGHLLSDGRTAQSALTCSYTHRLFFLALNVPTPPANLIGGILSGAAVHDPNARAVACRILFLRAHDRSIADLAARMGYLDADEDGIETELAGLGYRADAARLELAANIVTSLGMHSPSALCEAAPRDFAEIELTLDRLAPS